MGIFGDIGNWFSTAGNSIYNSVLKPIGNGIASAATTLYNSVLKPAYTNVIVPVANKVADVVQPVFNKLGQVGENLLDKGTDLVSKQLDTAGDISGAFGSGAKGLGNLMSNPLAWAGVGLAAIIILPKVLDKL